MTYAQILDNLEQNKPFVFMRWGDGEWNCIYRKLAKNTNTDGHHYFPELARSLKRILESENSNQVFEHGLQNFAKIVFQKEIDLYQNINWSDADVFVEQSRKGELKIKRILNDSLIVGNKNYLGKFKHVLEVPKVDAWLQIDSILDEVLDLSHHFDKIFFCCGMMAAPLMQRIHDHFDDLCLVDLGSVLDPYIGIQSRLYHKDIIKNKFTL